MGRLKAQTTSTKTPVLAFPTQAETASGVCPTILTCVSQQDRAVWSQPSDHILLQLHEVSFYLLKIRFMLIFIFNCVLQLQDDAKFKSSSWSCRLTWKKICDFKTAFEEAKRGKSSFSRLSWTRFYRIMMVCNLTIAKFQSALYNLITILIDGVRWWTPSAPMSVGSEIRIGYHLSCWLQ
jgi:hypothetical protein